MSRSNAPGPQFGLRARLTLLLGALLFAGIGATFYLTYRGTGSEVRRQIERDLRRDADDLDRDGIPVWASAPTSVQRAAAAYVRTRPDFGPGARLYVVRVPGKPPVTNEPALLQVPAGPSSGAGGPRLRGRRELAGRLRSLPTGLTTLEMPRVGAVRMLTQPIHRRGTLVALTEVGEPLAAVGRARAGVARSFLLGGSITLLLAVALGYAVASNISRPLRRMARTAAEVEAGDLSHRIRAGGPRDEVRVLADAFDRMLDRLADAFARQRGFVADASHELRTPLTVIRGQLEVLARQPDVTSDDVRRVDAVVRREILRMQRLVEDLMLLARADEGRFVRPQPLELDPFVTELFDGLTLTAERRFELGSVPGGVVMADPDRIAQVVRNLVRNAVEHTDPGGLVRLAVTGEEGRAVFTVEDDGPGIPFAQRARIFDRFHRTDASRARDSGGAGLGLAIARAIVEAHGGRISAGSSSAGGARVEFELPGWVTSTRPVSGRRSALPGRHSGARR